MMSRGVLRNLPSASADCALLYAMLLMMVVPELPGAEAAAVSFAPVVCGAQCRVQGSGCRVQGARCRSQGSGFRVQALGYSVPVSGFRVQGSGFRV